MTDAVHDPLLDELTAGLRPLETDLGRAWWAAMTADSPDHQAWHLEAELRLRAALADHHTFAAVRDALARADDPVARRCLERVHDEMLPQQLDDDRRRRLAELETEIQAIFNSHRGMVDGERVDDNRIAAILHASDDDDLRRRAWEASKSVGAAAGPLVLSLVRLRNEAARSVGYRDHYELSLRVGELDEARLLATLDEVDRVTAEPFRAWKASLDERLAARFGVAVDDLRPWHLGDVFFQEAPAVDAVDLDAYFADKNLEELTLRTFDGIGLDLRSVLAGSDLYGRDHKSQHAFAIDVDRAGDVRVLCNVVPNERWAETMLHEFGHAAYDRNIDPELPYLLHSPAHMLTTEAVAMMFGALSRDPDWLSTVAGMPATDVDAAAGALADSRRAGALVFARWALVMCHFERGLYADPDADHNTRWWDLVERYQLVRRPDDRDAPDWAAKIHLATAPVYYQNYLYGELLAAQLRAMLRTEAGGIVDRLDAGRLLVERVFRPGARLRWDHLIETATGEPITARHYAAELSA